MLLLLLLRWYCSAVQVLSVGRWLLLMLMLVLLLMLLHAKGKAQPLLCHVRPLLQVLLLLLLLLRKHMCVPVIHRGMCCVVEHQVRLLALG